MNTDQKILETLLKLEQSVTGIRNVMVTKEDLQKALDEQSDDICEVMHKLFIETDNLKADKSSVVTLEERVTKLESN